jgi:hypothetical protein
MSRIELITQITDLINEGKHIAIEVATWIYTNYPKLVKEKPTGLTVNIHCLSNTILITILEIAKKANVDEIPFWMTLGENP